MTETDPRALTARLLAASRYAMPIDEARRQITARRAALLHPPREPEPDFSTAQPFVHENPDAFARDFLARNPRAGPKRKPLEVIDGARGERGDNDNE